MANKLWEKQPNGYLKYKGDKPADEQLNLFSDYTRYNYKCSKCGHTWKSTYSTYENCLNCKSKEISMV